MTKRALLDHMRRLAACDEAVEWVTRQRKSPARMWAACRRGDWLIWLAARACVDRRAVVLAACDCAEPALACVPAGDDRPRAAIETARAWARGDATIDQVRAASSSAYDAAYAASAAASADVDAATAADAYAYAAAYAAAASYAASYAAAAAYAATYAAAASYADARSAALAHSADLVRGRITWAMVEETLND